MMTMSLDHESLRKPRPDREATAIRRRLDRRLRHRLPSWAPETALPGLLFAAIVPALFVFAGLGGVASAQGVEQGPVLERLTVETRITDALAVTHVSGEYWNPDPENASEAHVVFPFPESAVLTGFTLETANGTFIGVVQERVQARVSYGDAVERGEHAVLLEAAEDGRLSLRLNLPPQERVTLQMSYAQVLPLAHAQYDYVFPLHEILLGSGVDLTYDLTVTSTHNWTGLTVHGLGMRTVAQEPGYLHKHHESHISSQERPVTVQFRPDTQGYVSSVGVSSHVENASAVFQVLPSMQDVDALPMDLVFLVDTSGSMDSGKMEQAKTALDAILDELRDQDRFAIAGFSNQVDLHASELQPVAPGTIGAAHDWVGGLSSHGSTNISGSLYEAFGVLERAGHGTGEEDDRLPVIVLITDGMPNQWISQPGAIVQAVDDWNGFGARVHTVGIGFDQDNAFLNELARTNQGIYRGMSREADAAKEIAGFYQEIGTPLLRDVEVHFPGLNATQVHPRPLGDVYAGSHIVLAGRVDASGLPGDIEVVVTGTTADGAFNQTLTIAADDVHLVEETDRLWARQKAVTLERQSELGLVDASTARLELLLHGLEHQVATSTTSWLIVQEDDLDEVRANITKKLREAQQALDELAQREDSAQEDLQDHLGSVEDRTSGSDDAAFGPEGSTFTADQADGTYRRYGTPPAGGSGSEGAMHADSREEPTPFPFLAGFLLVAALAAIIGIVGRRRK